MRLFYADPGAELSSHDYRRSLRICRSTEDREPNIVWNALRRTERSNEDRAFDGGLISLRRAEGLTEDGGALFNMGLSTDDVGFNAGRNCQLRTERSTEGGALDAGLVTRWKT